LGQRGTTVFSGARILKGVRESRKEVGVMNRERLLRPREVARQLAVSRSTVYRWFWEGRLRGVKLNGGTLRILESAVQEKLVEAD
jgi:excisionase family DNA binding protein